MYILVAFIMLFGFVLTDILFTNFWRKIWGFSSSFYRSGALIITMLPILWIFNANLWDITPLLLLQFLWVGFAWALWIIFHLEAYKYLPVWIAGAIRKTSTLLVILLSYLFYNETLQAIDIIWGFILLISVIVLSLIKNNHTHIKNSHFLWVLFSLGTAFFGAIWFFLVSYFGRELNIWLSAYFSEAMIFIALILLLPINKLISGKYLNKISYPDFWKIFLYSTTALMWTWAFAYATNIGSIGVVSLIGSSAPVFVAIASYFLFKENLNKTQIFLIFTTFIGLAILSL